MARNKNKNHKRKKFEKAETKRFFLPQESKKYIAGLLLILLAVIISLSFFEKSGPAGNWLKNTLLFLVGKTVFVFPLLLLLSAVVSFRPRYKNFFYSLFLANSILVLGISGILEVRNRGELAGGWLGYLAGSSLFKLFDFLVTQIIFITVVIIGFFIFWNLLKPSRLSAKKEYPFLKEAGLGGLSGERIELGEKTSEKSNSLVTRVFQKVVGQSPKFKVNEVPSDKPIFESKETKKESNLAELEKQPISPAVSSYTPPPVDLLQKNSSRATPGDIGTGAAIIKKTLQNFGIQVEMAQVNVGPTVTQYTLKPAEGVKLSKITALSNDLALALAAPSIRIEAPIPGKSLVGIEVPNKTRASVRLRELIEKESFQLAPPLTFVLGRDVSGVPVYANLAKMPHLLVAGSTGSGKTVQLNTLILSLIYKNAPSLLRFILVDPKRVEFAVYAGLPHLLAPVIFDAGQTLNALKWLIGEMERRFDVLSEAKARDIVSYNSKVSESAEVLPYIVIIIDELADLMASRGREMEAGIVRLAQMARAVGIHLVVATQRPSVEVITGLIKANITSRITFQVASQVDSRTVLDTAGAEKLLGGGDMLYLSAEVGKPKRIQSAFVSEKEVKKVVGWLKQQAIKNRQEEPEEIVFENHLGLSLRETIEAPEVGFADLQERLDDDPLYEQAKREVILAKKASASLLQRRLRIGYARAARLLDLLQERGVVGPGQGAKPRQVYLKDDKENENWQKI